MSFSPPTIVVIVLSVSLLSVGGFSLSLSLFSWCTQERPPNISSTVLRRRQKGQLWKCFFGGKIHVQMSANAQVYSFDKVSLFIFLQYRIQSFFKGRKEHM